MSLQFSFIGNEFENLLRRRDIFMPAVQKIGVVFYDSAEKNIKALILDRNDETSEDITPSLDKPEQKVMVQKFRDNNIQYNWHKKDEIPFELVSKRTFPDNLFSEIENLILLLRYKNEADQKYDLLFVYFNQNLSAFGLKAADKVLSPDNKLIIGNIFYHYFKSLLALNRFNLSVLKSVNTTIKYVVNENLKLKEESSFTQKNYGESMVSLCQQYLQELSVKNNKKYLLSEETIQKIRTYKGNIRHLQDIIEQALVFMENLEFDNEADPLLIEAYSLNFERFQSVLKQEPETTRKIDSRESKTMLLLDKLETSASTLKSKNVPLIGINIGRAMTVPISAPAITDALKKHRRTILNLFGKYPDKWEVIRNEFRPVMNLMKAPELLEEKSVNSE